jgi:hypothetical protein
MKNPYIEYFEKNIIDKSQSEILDYALVSLSDIENKALEMRACRYNEDMDDYIDYLKAFISTF